MALERVAELVRRAAQDTGILRALKTNPGKLQSALNLSTAHLDALNSATAFPVRAKAQPVAKSAPGAQSRSAAKTLSAHPPTVDAKAGILAAKAATPLDATALDVPGNGGSLLPPEGSGQFTARIGDYRLPTPGPASPQGPSPQRPAPQPGPSPTPQVPNGPGSPTGPQPAPGGHVSPISPISPYRPSPGPVAPKQPGPSVSPSCPPGPSSDGQQRQATPSNRHGGTAPDSGCECCAIAGMVSAVSLTATTAITAITAITGLAGRRS